MTTNTRVSEAMVDRAFRAWCACQVKSMSIEATLHAALEAALSAPSGDGVPGMVLAAKDLLASLDPDALNPEQFNAWHALDAALSASSTGKETP